MCTVGSQVPHKLYGPGNPLQCLHSSLMCAKVYKFVHVMELNYISQDLCTVMTLLVNLYLYAHIWRKHGHLVQTSCVEACYMHWKLIMGCHGMYKSQLNIPSLNTRICREFCTVTDFLNLWLVFLSAHIVDLFTDACMQSMKSTKTNYYPTWAQLSRVVPFCIKFFIFSRSAIS